MSRGIDIALVGRNTIVREVLQFILSEHEFCVTSSVAKVADLNLVASDQTLILILLVDGHPADFDAESIAALHERFPAVRTVLLATEFDFGMVRRAFQTGVSGYLVNEIDSDRLIGLLDLVAMGEKVFPSQLADELVDHVGVSQHMGNAPSIHSANLSPREIEILNCLIMGLPNKVISRRLLISEATVKVHVKAVLRKLHVMNRTQAAIWGTSRGLHGFDSDEPLATKAVQAALTATSDLKIASHHPA